MLNLLTTRCVFITEIDYLHLESSERGSETNESMMLKMFYLYGFVWWTKRIWWTIENNYLLVYKLFEFAVWWILTIRNKAEIIFSSKNHLHYCNCWWKNKVYPVCLGVLCPPPQSSVQIKYLFSSAWLSFLQEFTTQEKSLSTIIFELSGLKM